MTKFEKIKMALEVKTKNTSDYVTLTKETDARHKGKYAIRNVITNNTYSESYKTLDDVIASYGLGGYETLINDIGKVNKKYL